MAKKLSALAERQPLMSTAKTFSGAGGLETFATCLPIKAGQGIALNLPVEGASDYASGGGDEGEDHARPLRA